MKGTTTKMNRFMDKENMTPSLFLFRLFLAWTMYFSGMCEYWSRHYKWLLNVQIVSMSESRILKCSIDKMSESRAMGALSMTVKKKSVSDSHDSAMH